MTTANLEQLIKDKDYDAVLEFYEVSNKEQGEVKLYDEQNDLCTLERKGDTLEYLRRSTPQENDVLGLRLSKIGNTVELSEFTP